MGVMHWHYTSYALLMLLAAALSLLLAFYAWRRRRASGATALASMMVAGATWATAYALETVGADIASKLFWANSKYLGIVAIPLFWLTFALLYTRRGRWVTHRNLTLLAVVPLISLALIWTNEAHHLFWRSRELDASGPFLAVDAVYGPWFWVHTAYSYLLILTGTVLMVRALVSPLRMYRGQKVALLVGVLVPWAGNAANLLGLNPVPNLDPTPLAFTVTGMALVWGLLRYRFLDILPVARDVAVDAIEEGVIVVDAQNRVVDLNPGAQRILGRAVPEAVGRDVAEVMVGQAGLLERCPSVGRVREEVRLFGDGAAGRDYDLTLSPLRDRSGQQVGTLMLLRDITEHKRAERALRESEVRFRTIFEQAAIGISTADPDRRILETNPAFHEMTGYAEEELYGKPIAEISHPDDVPVDAELNEKLLAGDLDRYQREKRYVRKDGELIWVRPTVSVVRGEEGETPFLIGMVENVTGRKRVEEALKEGEERYRAVVEQTAEGIYLLDVDTRRILEANAAFAGLLGYAPEELPGMTAYDFVTQDGEELEDNIRRTLEERRRFVGERRYRRKDGSPVDVEVNVSVIHYGGRDVICAAVRDVTERKRAEEALRESERRFRQLFENSADALLVHDETGRMVDCNAEACRSLGYSREELLSLSVKDYATNLVSEEERARREKEGGTLWQRAIAGDPNVPTSFHLGEHRRKDGTTFPVEVRVSGVYYGGKRMVLAAARDVTERTRAEAALRESEARFRTVVEGMGEGLLITDLEDVVLYANPRMAELSRYAVGEMLGKPSYELLLPPERWPEMLENNRRRVEGVGERYEMQLKRKDGTEFWAQVNATPYRDASGEVIGTVGINADVTERKRAEEALRESEERLRSLVGQAADAIFVHDLEGNLVDVNRRACESLGYAREELLVLSVADVEQNLQPGGFARLWERAVSDGPVTVEGAHRRKDGTIFPVEVRVGLFETGRHRLMLAMARDITERKEAEKALRKQNEYLVALHETALGLVDRLELKDMLDVVLARAAALLGASDGYVFLVEPGASEVSMTVALGVYARYEGYPHIVRRGEGFGGRVWESGKPLVVNDYRDWPGRKRVAGFEVPRAVAGVPIESGPRVIGVLTLAHTDEGRRFGGDEVEVLRRFAAFAAIALQNAELYDRARRELAERERAEEALREGQARLAEAQRIARVGSWEYCVGEDEAHWSDEMYRIFGHDPGSFVPTYRTFFRSVRPDDRRPLLKTFRKALRDGRHYGHSAEFSVVRPDGRASAVHARYEVIREDEAGRPTKMSGTLQDVTERKALEDRLEHQAFHDPLTGLPNRALFSDRLEHALARAERRGGKVAVLFMDLDNFKYVNDSLGHEMGDRLLAATAKRLEGCVRPEDTVARLGGDEFAVLLEGAEDAGEATRVAERTVEALREPFDLGEAGRELFAGTSVGIALGEAGRERPEDLLRKADLALYEAKGNGKARYALFDPEAERRSMRRLELENGLRRALERDELVVRYQPVVSLKTGRVVGFEALVRWEHPERGLVLPDEFVPLAEENGLIVSIGERVLREACRQTEAWQEHCPVGPPLIVGVNLSARQLSHPDLVGDVGGILEETGLDPGRLTLEVTESALVEDAERHAGALRRLKALGVRLAIDDFGTGYSSLSYLKRLPAGLLKLDGSFVGGIGEGPGEDEVLLEGVIGIAHGLGLEVVAEGVETAEQTARLRELGCDLAQGHLFSPPLSGEEATGFLRANAGGDEGENGTGAAGAAPGPLEPDPPRP